MHTGKTDIAPLLPYAKTYRVYKVVVNGLSQITVSAAHSDNAPKQPTDMDVDTILRVCQKIGIKCTFDKK